MVASTDIRKRGAIKNPNHQRSPPKGTLEKRRVRRGNKVMHIRNNIPWLCQKLLLPNSTWKKLIKRVTAPVKAKKVIKIFFIYCWVAKVFCVVAGEVGKDISSVFTENSFSFVLKTDISFLKL